MTTAEEQPAVGLAEVLHPAMDCCDEEEEEPAADEEVAVHVAGAEDEGPAEEEDARALDPLLLFTVDGGG